MSVEFENHEKFMNDLWKWLSDGGFYTYPKADICDYLLYLFNKHDKNHFLDSNSNSTNERLLKMSAAKIKSAKKNISLKFMSKSEFEQVFVDFLLGLNEKKVHFDTDKDQVKITIENPVLRGILEAKLKDAGLGTFDYRFNTEIVVVNGFSFVSMLSKELKSIEKSLKKDDASEIEKILYKKLIALGIDDFLTLFEKSPQEALAGLAKKFISIFV